MLRDRRVKLKKLSRSEFMATNYFTSFKIRLKVCHYYMNVLYWLFIVCFGAVNMVPTVYGTEIGNFWMLMAMLQSELKTN